MAEDNKPKYDYVGSVKFTKNGRGLLQSFSLKQLQYMITKVNAKGYLNLYISEKSTHDKYGTHNCSILPDNNSNYASQPTEHSVDKGNGYVKETSHRYSEENRPQGQVSKPTQNQDVKENEEDDIPF